MDVETRFGPVERSFVCPLGHAVRRVVLHLAIATCRAHMDLFRRSCSDSMRISWPSFSSATSTNPTTTSHGTDRSRALRPATARSTRHDSSRGVLTATATSRLSSGYPRITSHSASRGLSRSRSTQARPRAPFSPMSPRPRFGARTSCGPTEPADGEPCSRFATTSRRSSFVVARSRRQASRPAAGTSLSSAQTHRRSH